MLDSAVISTLDEILAAHQGLEGPLLPILHSVQAAFGHIPAEVLPVIAQHLNISKAEVHGVVSFYHDFREAPA
ncbi:MAG: NAD(P)H-dependent oxidoreductase subunit E, partial [Paracoccaceae bacterium]